ncbi:glycoside hydrolase [Annulohypoxylon truncatum]|uniref:glycoside hydrolase n=1 Tax=Annulohypoxylon truncatum TaxID=327061 RepID=UPI002008AB6D|nr:glycoside hydrolase [Annulohypoxylon truncatum]KAI1208224.1 glycoside hydrolase [Annulohypoxylon truncatum]
MASQIITSLVLALAARSTLAANTPVPFYGQSASGKTSPPRGWNSFVAQSNGVELTVDLLDEQCSFFYNNTEPGFNYVCGFDSGWSADTNGDEFGRIIPKDTVFNTTSIQEFAAKVHSNGMKLGVYMIPGGFTSDAQKLVKGTNITIGSLFNTTEDPRDAISNSYNARNDFDYTKDGVQEWHDSVVELFSSWGVDFVKLDYVTPGSDYLTGNKDNAKPANDSGAVACMHNAIMKYAPGMQLDISWRLEREEPFWDLWQHNADTLRVDRDINFGNNPVTWGPTQRTIEQYRVFINQQVLDSTRQNKPIMIRPDMDNLLVATPSSSSSWSGYSTIERYAQAILWIGAGANLINGCDMTKVDDLGKKLLTDSEVLGVAAFTANYPMVPKNPSSAQVPGGPNASQLQAWIAGPNDNGTAIVVLSNLGPDECWDSECSYNTTIAGDQLVNVTLSDLGIGGDKWFVRRVLGGGGRGGDDGTDIGVADAELASWLSEHESVLYKLQKCGSEGASC